MSIIYLLIPISLILLAVAIWAFFWAVDNNQFDDMEGPAHSILFDEEPDTRSKKQQAGSSPSNDNRHT